MIRSRLINTTLMTSPSSGFSAYHYAWDAILFDSREPSASKSKQALLELFPQDEGGLDERQFSRIHKCVLGIVGTKLRDELEISTSSIDDFDNLGRTPLYWAARRGDFESAKLLLAYGARCEIPGMRKGTEPQLAAAKAGDDGILGLLLNHGANIEAKDPDGFTSIIYASCREIGLECVKLLINAGADVNSCDNDNRTALHYASQNGCLEIVEILLAAGANINALCEDGWTALACCVFWNMHDSIEMLLNHGADTLTKTDPGESILHLAARYGDETTLKILAERDLGPMDIDATTVAGETVRRIAQEREESGEWISALENLLKNMAERNAGRTLKSRVTVGLIHEAVLLKGALDAPLDKDVVVKVEDLTDEHSDDELFEDALDTFT